MEPSSDFKSSDSFRKPTPEFSLTPSSLSAHASTQTINSFIKSRDSPNRDSNITSAWDTNYETNTSFLAKRIRDLVSENQDRDQFTTELLRIESDECVDLLDHQTESDSEAQTKTNMRQESHSEENESDPGSETKSTHDYASSSSDGISDQDLDARFDTIRRADSKTTTKNTSLHVQNSFSTKTISRMSSSFSMHKSPDPEISSSPVDGPALIEKSVKILNFYPESDQNHLQIQQNLQRLRTDTPFPKNCEFQTENSTTSTRDDHTYESIDKILTKPTSAKHSKSVDISTYKTYESINVYDKPEKTNLNLNIQPLASPKTIQVEKIKTSFYETSFREAPELPPLNPELKKLMHFDTEEVSGFTSYKTMMVPLVSDPEETLERTVSNISSIPPARPSRKPSHIPKHLMNVTRERESSQYFSGIIDSTGGSTRQSSIPVTQIPRVPSIKTSKASKSKSPAFDSFELLSSDVIESSDPAIRKPSTPTHLAPTVSNVQSLVNRTCTLNTQDTILPASAEPSTPGTSKTPEIQHFKFELPSNPYTTLRSIPIDYQSLIKKSTDKTNSCKYFTGQEKTDRVPACFVLARSNTFTAPTTRNLRDRHPSKDLAPSISASKKSSTSKCGRKKSFTRKKSKSGDFFVSSKLALASTSVIEPVPVSEIDHKLLETIKRQQQQQAQQLQKTENELKKSLHMIKTFNSEISQTRKLCKKKSSGSKNFMIKSQHQQEFNSQVKHEKHHTAYMPKLEIHNAQNKVKRNLSLVKRNKVLFSNCLEGADTFILGSDTNKYKLKH